MIDPNKYPPYPDCYLHVRDCKSGEEWIMPLTGRSLLDLTRQVKKWVREEFSGEMRLDGELMPRLEGDYYAQLKTDSRPPGSMVCWTSGGFYLKGCDE